MAISLEPNGQLGSYLVTLEQIFSIFDKVTYILVQEVFRCSLDLRQQIFSLWPPIGPHFRQQKPWFSQNTKWGPNGTHFWTKVSEHSKLHRSTWDGHLRHCLSRCAMPASMDAKIAQRALRCANRLHSVHGLSCVIFLMFRGENPFPRNVSLTWRHERTVFTINFSIHEKTRTIVASRTSLLCDKNGRFLSAASWHTTWRHYWRHTKSKTAKCCVHG